MQTPLPVTRKSPRTRLLAALAVAFSLTATIAGAETIQGTVRTVADSTAVAGAKVYVVSNNVRTDSTTTDAQGAYTFEVASGFFTVQAESDGYAMGTGNAFFFNGATEATVNFYLGTPGSITGTVRKLGDSTALAGAKVLLRQGNNDGSAVIDSAVTDANGAYAFDGLSPSNTGGFGGSNPYRVYASADGMVNASVTGINLALSDTVVTDFYLGAAATISGTVRKSSDNGVLEGATVTLRRGSATGTVLQTDTTDAQGQYAFADVAPGSPDYWISASDSGLATATNAGVVVGSGAAVVSDLSLDGILPGDITGTVRTAADSAALAGATVYLRRGNANSDILDSAVSAANGSFSFTGLEAGSPNYVLTVSATALATVTLNNVVVPNGAAVTVNAYLPTLGGIAGTVRTMTDSTAVANALVLLRRGNSDDSEILDSARTDANGAYAFADLAASTGGFGGQGTQYRVYASATGYAQASNTGISVSNGATTTSDLYLGAPGSLSGTVIALPDSVPLANALVSLSVSNGFFSTVVDSILTDSLGRYAFEDLTPGESYQLDVSADGYVTADTAGIDIGSGDDATADFVLGVEPTGVLVGKVGSAADSGIVANALVVLRRGSVDAAILDSARTDSTGRFVFPKVLVGSANYWLTVSAAGYESATNDSVTVTENDTTVSDFMLATATAVHPATAAARTQFTARRLADGWIIRMPAASTARTFTMHDVRGVLIHRATVPAGATEVTVSGVATAPGAGVLMRLR